MSNPTNIYYTVAGTDYTFPFPYLSAANVAVTIDGVAAPFTLIAQNTVRIDNTGYAGKTLRIYRETPKTPIHTWEDGAVILGAHMNASHLQSIYIAEEAHGYAEGIAEEAKQFALDGVQVAVTSSLNDAKLALENSIADDVLTAQGHRDQAEYFRNEAEGFKNLAENAADAGVNAALDIAQAALNTQISDATEALSGAVRAAEGYANDAAGRANDAQGFALSVGNAEDIAQTAALASEAAYVAFRRIYLGGFPDDPTLDLEGGDLNAGALYYNTAIEKMKFFDGFAWQIAYNAITTPPATVASDIENDSGVSGNSVKDALNSLNTAKANASHNHALADIAGLDAALAGKAVTSHNHAQDDITGLESALEAKADAAAVSSALAGKADITGLDAALAGKADTSHNHAPADITGLDAALAAKADASELATGLAGKADASHLHTIAELPKATPADFRGSTDDTKVLTSKAAWDSAAHITISQASTLAVDMGLGYNFTTTMTGSRTLGNPTNVTVGKSGTIYIVQDGTGSRTLSYASYWRCAGGLAPALSTAPGAVDSLHYKVRSPTWVEFSLSNGVS